jgi:hypothetical protein
MKKITLFVAAVAVLASCNREDALTTASGGNAVNLNVKNYEKSELQNMITPMSQSFGFNGKTSATQLNFRYRAWAEPVILNLHGSGIEGTDANTITDAAAKVVLSASAAWSVNDMVFVAWHAEEQLAAVFNVNTSTAAGNAVGTYVGGCITAYKQSGIGRYEFMDRVDFFDADYHELYGDVNASSQSYEIMLAGQRAQSTSGYILSGHSGAVVTRMDYDFINDEFYEGSMREIPLPGVSANDVVGAARRFYVTTGGATTQGFVYELDRNLTNVVKQQPVTATYSGRALAIDNRIKGAGFLNANSDRLYVLSTDGIDKGSLQEQTVSYVDPTTTFGIIAAAAQVGNISAHTNFERADLTIATSDDNPFDDPNLVANPIVVENKRIFATVHSANLAGVSTVYNFQNDGSWNVPFSYGNAISTEYDPSLDVLYVAMGGDANSMSKAIKVVALDKYATMSPVINEYDLVGEFADPDLSNVLLSSGLFMSPNLGDVKEITIYGSRNIALAAGSQGVYFIQRDAL